MAPLEITTAKQFQTHPIIANHHLNEEELEKMQTIFATIDLVQQHAAVVEKQVVLDEEQFLSIVDAFKRAYELFKSHFNGLNIEVVKLFLKPLQDFILSSSFYNNAIHGLDEMFFAIELRISEVIPQEA